MHSLFPIKISYNYLKDKELHLFINFNTYCCLFKIYAYIWVLGVILQPMTLQELTLNILAERILTTFDSKKLVNWAVDVILLGYGSENLYVLAGLDFESTEEREKYFIESLKDLQIGIETDEEKLIENYAITLTKKVVEKVVDIDYGFKQMLKIVTASEYDQKYISFFEIEEDLDYLRYDN